MGSLDLITGVRKHLETWGKVLLVFCAIGDRNSLSVPYIYWSNLWGMSKASSTFHVFASGDL